MIAVPFSWSFLYFSFFLSFFFIILCYFVKLIFYKNYVIIIIFLKSIFFSWKFLLFFHVLGCSGMFRNVPCSGFYRRPISLLSFHNYDVKLPNIKFTWERERQGDKFYLSVQTWARSPLFSSSQNPLLLSNRANWDNGEKVLNDAMSVFQRRFHGRRPCRIVRSLVFEVGSLMLFLKLIVLFRVIYYCQIYSSIRCLK